MGYKVLKQAAKTLQEDLSKIAETKVGRSHDSTLKNPTVFHQLEDSDEIEAYSEYMLQAVGNVACILSDGLNSYKGIVASIIVDTTLGIRPVHVSLDDSLLFLDSNRSGTHIVDERTYLVSKAMLNFLDTSLGDPETLTLLQKLPPSIQLEAMRVNITKEISAYENGLDLKSRATDSPTLTDPITSDDSDEDSMNDFKP
ncbi:MAG: hypothetical protein P1U74_01000 [Legionellaceae bacterium]|nr:hypothetical protein [Legionellaceae bacterium]